MIENNVYDLKMDNKKLLHSNEKLAHEVHSLKENLNLALKDIADVAKTIKGLESQGSGGRAGNELKRPKI